MQTWWRAGRSLAVVALLLSMACGDDAAPELTPTAFELRIDDLWCARYAECSGRAPYESCKQELRIDDGFARFPYEGEQVASGRVVFHADRAAACLQAIEQASCAAVVGFEWVNTVEAICLEVYEPAQKEHDPCDADPNNRLLRECQGWMACDKEPACDPTTTCCQGTCSTHDGDDPAQVGAEGAACTSDRGCGVALACGAAGTCVVPRELGDHCWYYCAGDNVCRDGECQAPEVVSTVTTCGNGTSDTRVCDANHYCATDGTCWPFAKAGEACGAGVGVCDWFYECPNDTHVCTLKRQDGEACSVVTQCQGRRSQCLQGVCTPPLANGEACSEDKACMSNRCDGGVCRDVSVCDLSTISGG
jgi:hypothetical protein